MGLLKPVEVAKLLRLDDEESGDDGVATLHRWRYTRKGPPAIKCGKYLRYDEAALEQWLSEHADDGNRVA